MVVQVEILKTYKQVYNWAIAYKLTNITVIFSYQVIILTSLAFVTNNRTGR